MTLLLDTHTILWLEQSPDKISRQAQTQVYSEPNLFISVSSIWEIAIKIKTGKLDVATPLEIFVRNFLSGYDARILNVALPHVYYT